MILKINKRRLITSACFIVVLALIYLVFLPQRFDVPTFKPRANTQYWDLPTGSKIGYTLLKSKLPTSKTPIIYLHGGPGGAISNEHIEQMTSFTQQGYPVYLYDQVGSGHSNRLANINDYSTQRHIEDLEAIIQQIKASKVILLGHSWGAILATFFTCEHVDKVEKVILVGPGSIYPVNPKLKDIKSPDSLHLKAPLASNQQGNAKAYGMRQKFIRWLAYVYGTKLGSDEEVDNFYTYLNSHLGNATVCDTTSLGTPLTGLGYYVHVMTMKSLYNMGDKRKQIHQLTMPFLVLKGQCDNQHWGYTREYLNLLPNAQLQVIPDAGHHIFSEQPQLYTQHILQFLED